MALSTAADPSIKPADSQSVQPITPADSLDRAVDRWYEATLAGDNGKTREYEQRLVHLLAADIDRTQDQVNTLTAHLADNSSDSLIGPLPPGYSANPIRDSLSILKDQVRLKRMLLGAITQSDAFSNKYRLLGDYVDLLRREVGLPKLKLAADKRIEAVKN
jgi:hypothetical protein